MIIMHEHSKQLIDGKAEKGRVDGVSPAKPLMASPLVEELPQVPINLIIDMERKKREKPVEAPRAELEIPEIPAEREEDERDEDGGRRKEKDECVVIISFF